MKWNYLAINIDKIVNKENFDEFKFKSSDLYKGM